MRTRPVLVVATAALLALVPSAASAHHPEIEGRENCDGLITFTAEAWHEQEATPERRTNKDVHVKILQAGEHGHRADPIAEFDDQFVPGNHFKFSGQHQLDRAREVIIVVIAKAKWGPHEDLAEPGKSRHTKVSAPSDCDQDEGEETTTSGPTSTTLPEDTTGDTVDTNSTVSTVAPETTHETTTTSAEVVVTADQTPPAAGGGSLPFTGSNTVPMLVGGISLIAAGIFALRYGRRRRPTGSDS